MCKGITVLCVGNYLMGDEGVGVHFARMMEKEGVPEGVTVIDGGSGGFKLLEYMDDDNDLVLVDAMLDDRPPGTITMRKPRFA